MSSKEGHLDGTNATSVDRNNESHFGTEVMVKSILENAKWMSQGNTLKSWDQSWLFMPEVSALGKLREDGYEPWAK